MKHEPMFTPLDLREWSRGEQFWYFSQAAPTGYSLTAELDITSLRAELRRTGRKFYPAYLWLVTRAQNEQTEFKVAERDGQVGFYDFLTPLYAVFHEDDKTFSLMWTEFDEDFGEFYAAYERDGREYGANHGILAKKEPLPPPNAYIVSCLPRISFKHFAVHSYGQPYYFPSVECGKFYEKDEQVLLPLSVTCHHAATDGWHVSRFLEKLQSDMDRFAEITE